MLVERIVITYWRLRRIMIVETGSIKKKTDNFHFKQFLKRVKKAESYNVYGTLTSLYTRLTNSISCKRFIEVVEELIKLIEEMGYLPEVELKKYASLTNSLIDKEGFSWLYFFNEIAKGNIEEEPKEKGKKAILMTLKKKLDHAKSLIDVIKEIEDDEDESGAMMAYIPDKETSEKLNRYERSLEKSLYKALNQLIKLQALRKGGKVVSFKTAELEGISNN